MVSFKAFKIIIPCAIGAVDRFVGTAKCGATGVCFLLLQFLAYAKMVKRAHFLKLKEADLCKKYHTSLFSPGIYAYNIIHGINILEAFIPKCT